MTSWNIVSIVTHHAHNFICPILWALPLIISFNTNFAIFQYFWDFQITFNILHKTLIPLMSSLASFPA